MSTNLVGRRQRGERGWLWGALVGSLVIGGCSRLTDFDYEFAADSASPGTDGGMEGPDSRSDGGVLPSECSSDCLGAVVEDFRPRMQGVGTVGWRFLADRRDPMGLDYAELAWGTWSGAEGFVDPEPDGAPPAIIRCADHPDVAPCEGIPRSLAVVSDPPSGNADAAVELIAPRDGLFRLEGSVRTTDGAAGFPHQLLVTRNGRNDLVHLLDPMVQAGVERFDSGVDLLQGDALRITLRARPDFEGSRPVGLALALMEADSGSGDCLFAATFDGLDALQDRCGGAVLEDTNDGLVDPDPGTSEAVVSVASEYGMARSLVEGQFLRSTGSPLDYSGDFTIQLWVRVREAERRSFGFQFFADATTEPPSPGGVTLTVFGEDRVGYRTFYSDPDNPLCDQGICLAGGDAVYPTDGEWHFYRVVRSAADDRMSLCIDGRAADSIEVPGDRDLTSSYAPYLGRNVVFNPAYAYIDIDDVRVYRRALPCGA